MSKLIITGPSGSKIHTPSGLVELNSEGRALLGGEQAEYLQGCILAGRLPGYDFTDSESVTNTQESMDHAEGLGHQGDTGEPSHDADDGSAGESGDGDGQEALPPAVGEKEITKHNPEEVERQESPTIDTKPEAGNGQEVHSPGAGSETADTGSTSKAKKPKKVLNEPIR